MKKYGNSKIHKIGKQKLCNIKISDSRSSPFPYLFILGIQYVHKQLWRSLWSEETSSRRSVRSVKRVGRFSILNALVGCFIHYNTQGMRKIKGVTVGQLLNKSNYKMKDIIKCSFYFLDQLKKHRACLAPPEAWWAAV